MGHKGPSREAERRRRAQAAAAERAAAAAEREAQEDREHYALMGRFAEARAQAGAPVTPDSLAREARVQEEYRAAVAGERRRKRRPRRPADEVAVDRLRRALAAEAWRVRQAAEARKSADRYVMRLRSLGWSWARIAAEVGMTRQGLQKRYPGS